MKRHLTFGFIVIFAILALLMFAPQATAKSIEVYLDDEPISFEVDPLIDNGTTLVQLRPLFEAMGLELEWEHETKTIIGTKDETEIVLRVDEYEAIVNGKTISLIEPPRVVNGNTLVPIRFISESTGAEVGWNPYVPEILIFSENYLIEHGLSREDIQDAVDEKVRRMKQELENKIGRAYEPADDASLDLNDLRGMYAGYRIDPDGKVCGGMCWDIYTFFADNKVVIGYPANGGPETIDCELDRCYTYTIENGKLKLDSGESYSISIEKGFLNVNDVLLTPVKPVKDVMKLADTYYYYGYSGSIDDPDTLRSWIFMLTFDEKGAFTKEFFQVGQIEGSVPGTEIFSEQEGEGTYTISGNTLTLQYNDGRSEQLLFFVHDNVKMGELEDIQVGPFNFYVSTE